MPEDGLIVTKIWHTQLLASLDFESIPFRRCVEARVHALSIRRSHTLEYPRCRNVEVKHLVVTKDICFRCSTRRKIQTLTTMRRLYEDQSAMWKENERRDAEFVSNIRRSIRDSPRSILVTKKETVSAAGSLLTSVKGEPVMPLLESWARYLENQLQQRKLAKAKEAERLAKAEEGEQKEKRKAARLASVQQHLARMIRLSRCSPTKEDTVKTALGQGKQPLGTIRVRTMHMGGAEAGSSSDEMASSEVHEKVPGPISSPDSPAPLDPHSSAAVTGLSPNLPRFFEIEARIYGIGPSTPVKGCFSSGLSSAGAAAHPTSIFASVRGPSTLRAEATEFASLRGFPCSLGPGFLRPEAPEFKPLRQLPPTEPRMMRAPLAPRAMREGSSRQLLSSQPRQKYFSNRGYPPIRGWRD